MADIARIRACRSSLRSVSTPLPSAADVLTGSHGLLPSDTDNGLQTTDIGPSRSRHRGHGAR